VKNAVTELLGAWKAGDAAAGAKLAETLYTELMRLSRYHLSHERHDHTLSPTALVHELFLRLFGRNAPEIENRAHLMAVVSQQLRRILIDHVRRTSAAKRGDGAVKVTLNEMDIAGPGRQQEILEVDELLDRLSGLDPRAAQVVEMRFFGGFEESEIAEALSVSIATVKRDWRFARACLTKMLQEQRALKEPRPSH
jgi:RNA polymerase sigma-70 factor (ECF subfamily)